MSSLYVPVLQYPVLKARKGKGPGWQSLVIGLRPRTPHESLHFDLVLSGDIRDILWYGSDESQDFELKSQGEDLVFA